MNRKGGPFIFDTNEKTIDNENYVTREEANLAYFNMNSEEKLEKDLNAGNNKILNVNDESDVVTKREGVKLEARVQKTLNDQIKEAIRNKVDKNSEIDMQHYHIIN